MPIQADPLACGDWETKVEFCPKLKQKKGKQKGHCVHCIKKHRMWFNHFSAFSSSLKLRYGRRLRTLSVTNFGHVRVHNGVRHALQTYGRNP